MAADFKGDPFKQPDPMAGELGEDEETTHMRAFQKAMKSGDVGGMTTALKAFVEACTSAGYAETDLDEMG